MEDIIYINDKTGQIVPKNYPDAIKYVRAQDGVIFGGDFYSLVKDEGEHCHCNDCALDHFCDYGTCELFGGDKHFEKRN